MGALADILLAGANPIVALALICLAIGEGFLLDYTRRRFDRWEDNTQQRFQAMEDRIDDRLSRVEDALIRADGCGSSEDS